MLYYIDFNKQLLENIKSGSFFSHPDGKFILLNEYTLEYDKPIFTYIFIHVCDKYLIIDTDIPNKCEMFTWSDSDIYFTDEYENILFKPLNDLYKNLCFYTFVLDGNVITVEDKYNKLLFINENMIMWSEKITQKSIDDFVWLFNLIKPKNGILQLIDSKRNTVILDNNNIGFDNMLYNDEYVKTIHI